MFFSQQSQKLQHQLLIVVILLITFALRIIAIDQIPAGLSHDEAYNGVTAMQVLNGERRVFFEINKGIEPLIIYLEAAAFYWFGIGPVQLRLVNIFFGMLTVALVYPFTARLINRRMALLAMAGVASSFWAIFVSRLTLRAVLLPPFLLLALYFFWRGLKPITNTQGALRYQLPKLQSPFSTLLFFALSGLATGITMYTYLSSRFVPLILFTIFGYFLIRRRINRWHWLGLVLHTLIWAMMFVPLGNYFLEHSESFTRRADQVSTIPQIMDGNYEPVVRSTIRTLGMFTFRGDTTDRYNLDGRPVFDWLNGLLFYIGFWLALRRLRRSFNVAAPAVVLISTAFFMLLPDFITDDSPHFLRTIGTLPVIYIFWAIGLDWLAQQLRKSSLRTAHRAALMLISVLLLSITLHTGYDYFWRWATSPNGRYIYGADIAEIADYIKSHFDGSLTVISAEYYRDLDPFRFALHFAGSPPFVIWFDGRQSLAFPPPESDLHPRYAFPASAPPADIWADFLQRSPQESGQAYDLYRLSTDSASLQTRLTPVGATVNNELIINGYQLLGSAASGGKFQLLIGWQALRARAPGTDYTFLVQMRDNQNYLWLEVDGNGYPPASWQPGVQGLQLLTLRLPPDLPPRTYHLSLQIIDRKLGQALPVNNNESSIPLTSIQAALADTPHPVEPDRLPNPTDPDSTSLSEKTGLKLRGYELSGRNLPAGSNLEITLHWQVQQQPQQNYQLEFFLIDESGHSIYTWSAMEPTGGEWPTDQWPANYWVQDKLNLNIGDSLPEGTFILRSRWLDEMGQPVSDNVKDNHNYGRLTIVVNE